VIPKPLRAIGWLLSLIVVVAVIAAFLVVGSPMEARKQSADAQRVSDLASIVQMVREYRIQNHKLPERLTDCVSYPTQEGVLNDPQTGKPYEYRALPGDKFELCATFETDTTKKPVEPNYGYGASQEVSNRHPIGRVCQTYPAKSGTGK